MKFSRQEIQDLMIAWVLISVAVAIALHQPQLSFFSLVLISAITVGVAFIIHELAHKYVATLYGKFAEFRANIALLVLSLAIAFSGVLFAAPGAVHISGFVNSRENALIAAAGPVANIVLALILLPLFYLLPASELFLIIIGFSIIINSWLALFNLIPFWEFDGAKIIMWNKPFYAMLVLLSVVLVFISTTGILANTGL